MSKVLMFEKVLKRWVTVAKGEMCKRWKGGKGEWCDLFIWLSRKQKPWIKRNYFQKRRITFVRRLVVEVAVGAVFEQIKEWQCHWLLVCIYRRHPRGPISFDDLVLMGRWNWKITGLDWLGFKREGHCRLTSLSNTRHPLLDYSSITPNKGI